MIHTFIINLDESKDRWLSIKQQLDGLGIEYERLSASNPSKMTADEIKKIYDEEKAKKIFMPNGLTLGSIGCSHSHLRIYKKIVEENIPIALVFEDDVIIDKRVKEIYDDFNNKKVKYIKRDYLSMNYGAFDAFYLWKHIKKTKNQFLNDGKLFKFLLFLLGGLFYAFMDFPFRLFARITRRILIIKRYRPFYLTGGYFITKRGAEKLLAIHDKVFTVADFLPEKYRHVSKLKFYITVPVLVQQATEIFPSTNK